MNKKTVVSAIILAAGSGTRFGEKKQNLYLNDKMLWQIVLDKVETFIPRERIVVVGIDCDGGSTRTGSVKAGLNSLNDYTDKVIILEAARPLVNNEQILTLINDSHSSASFCMDLVDTVISKNGDYLNRSEYCNLQTPQAFDYQLLKEAYSDEKYVDMTDETRVMFDAYNIKPNLLPGGINLMKVTYKNDFFTIQQMINESII